MKKNYNNSEPGGIIALVIGIALCLGMGLVTGVKVCGKMIWELIKSARRFITGYLTGSDEDRSALALSLKCSLKTFTIALVIVLGSGFCVNVLYDGIIRKMFSFAPEFLLGAAGFLALGVGVRTVVCICEKMGVRTDVTIKARKLVEFGMAALMPIAVYKFVTYATPEGISMVLACAIASWAYREINKFRAKAEKTTAPVATN